MNAATEFDVGPLTWVKSEIDLALERTATALRQFGESADATQLKFGRTHLHQVRGALAIVGLDGVTQFTDALESLFDDFDAGTVAPDAESIALALRALDAVRHYLDDLVGGEPNQALRLFPLYREILARRGQQRVAATDLFFPDLTLRPPRRNAAPQLARGELQTLLKTQRASFQRGLLAWLRNPADRNGVAQMVEAVHRVEATQELAAARAFWWIAGGMLTALAEGTLPAEVDIKQLCARIDLQIRRLIEGSQNVAERLMRDALYYVAQADSDNAFVREVKRTYQVENAVPAAAHVAAAPQDAQRRRVREAIAATEESWNKFCAGSVPALQPFRDNAANLQQQVEALGHTDFRRLAQAIASTANWIAEQPSRHNEALAMEIATAILLTQNAQENFTRLGGDFAHQVDVMVARLHGFLAGNPPQPGSEVPLLDEMSQRAQEKLLIGQVAKEIQTNLAQIEQALDNFFRDAERRGDLAGLDAPLHQVIGALTMMGQNDAVDSLRQCAGDIRRFAAPDYVPDEADFERVADRLSELGFFIDAMQHGAEDFAAFTRAMQARGATPEAEETAGSVEQEIESAKRETQALLEAVKEQPSDERLREELKQNLETLKQDADLVADAALGQQAKAALSALAAGDTAAPAIDAALAGIKPQAAEAPAPSAETLQLAQASEDELDAELLAIFTEEAKEVLETIAASLEQLHAHPHDLETLTTIRRSYHTLKGSGRMVGLRDLGETAWGIEQVLNIWLRQELGVTPQLFDLVEQGRDVFTAWVAHIEQRSLPLPDATALQALAAEMKAAAEGSTAAPAAAAPAASAPVAAPEIPADEETFAGADATLVLGGFGTTVETPADEALTGIEAIELPSLEVDEDASASDYDATKTLVLGFDTRQPAAEAAPEEAFALPELSFGEAGTTPEAAAPAAEEPPAATDGAAPAAAPGIEIPAEDMTDLTAEFSTDLTAEFEAVAEEAIAAEEEAAAVAAEPEPAAEAAEPEPEPEPEAEPARPTAEIIPITAAITAAIAAAIAAAAPPASGPQLTISQTLYEIFLEEARGHLATLQREFGNLEIDPQQATPFAMARAAHTLAGISATVGLPAINRLGLALEHALLRRETAADPADVDALEIVRETVVAIETQIAAVAERSDPQPQPALVEALERLYPVQAAEPLEAYAAPEVPAQPVATPESAAAAPAAAVAEAPAASPAARLAEAPALKDELDEQLLPIFLEEAQELQQAINEQLRLWRATPDDSEAPRALHRLFHTLKGSARMAGAMTLGEITHAIETRVEQLHKSGSAPLPMIDEIEDAFDSVIQILERLQRGESLAAPAPAASATETAEEGEAAATSTVAATPLATPGTGGEPAAAETAEEGGETAGEAGTAQRAMLRVRADLIDQLVNEAGELSIARARIEGEMIGLKGSLLDLTENVIRLRRQLRDIEIQAESQMQSRVAQTDELHAGFDPLEFDRFTRFQELTRMMAESVNDVATVQQNLLKNLDDANAAILAQARMNRQLQQELMSVRMVPFASQAERLYRIVRQTAKELGKRANLEIRGGQVEIDRSVLDKIGAPLEHLLRNAVAHGLETREARLAAGKPEIGEVTLSLTQEGNEIILGMSDDGAGLDYDRIRKRGIEAGLLAPDEAADEGRLIKLIFTPGFSTALEVNQIAGRGIGMDVVKTDIGALGGRIEVQSSAGKGTTFRLYIPLTLAVTQALLVRAGAHVYAVPSAMIEQVLELRESFLARIREAGEAEWLGNHYPYRFLPHLLGDAEALPEARRQYWVLLLRSGLQRVAVQVDELLGNREIVVKNIGAQLARVVGIDGATVLGDGQVVLILNPVALASRTRATVMPVVAPTALAPAPAADKISTLPTVMVVDDSLTVRKITGRLLAREGYQVLTAKDGVDALEQLLDVVPDVMLVDIEMPRMDGFDLTRNVRGDERLKDVPIIMITSRTADKHRNYAFEIGVNHYLGKPYQEDELLKLVGGYTQAKRPH